MSGYSISLQVCSHHLCQAYVANSPLGHCTYTNLAHLQPITSLSIDNAGFSLVSGSHDCSIRFWDLIDTRHCTQEAQPHREKAGEGVLDVDFHPALPFMASAGADGTVKLYASS